MEDWLERRRALDQDLYDEVWGGDYHVAPAPHGRHGQVDFELVRLLGPYAAAAGLRGSGPCTIGKPDDYRVPDQAYFRDTPSAVYHPTAAVVVEIVSPGDESRAKFDFYFRAGVDEVFVVDPDGRTVEVFARGDGAFVPVDRSGQLAVGADELRAVIDWPA